MNVLDVIKREHREVAALFKEVENCDPGDERIYELARAIETNLSTHLTIEERLLYSVLRDRSEEQDERVDVFEAYTEHAVARTLLELVGSGRKPDERFKAELQVLGESVNHHVKEEESKMFSVAREHLSKEELDEMAGAWEKAKARAQRARASNGARKRTRKKAVRGTTTTAKRTRKR